MSRTTDRPRQPAPAPLFDDRGRDPRAAGDALIPTSRVAADASGDWVVLGHEEAIRVAEDPTVFSSAASSHLQIPNGLDGAEHTAFRRLIDPFFAPERMARFEPRLREVTQDLLASLEVREDVEVIGEIGNPFAVAAQTAWLGWPTRFAPRLLAWMEENHDASRSGDRDRTAKVAADFDALIGEIIDPRLAQGPTDGPSDLTDELLAARVREPGGGDRALRHEEIVSILRNWTGGDLGSIALCVGVVLGGLAADAALQQRVRAAGTSERAAIIDELLRRDDPFVANRRVATCPVELGGQEIGRGERVRIHWTSANRDPEVFADPDGIDPDGHAAANLVFGTGPHVCPGRPLATLELCVLTRMLLDAFDLAPSPRIEARREISPVGGFRTVGLSLRRR
jgi:cytochrome P450